MRIKKGQKNESAHKIIHIKQIEMESEEKKPGIYLYTWIYAMHLKKWLNIMKVRYIVYDYDYEFVCIYVYILWRIDSVLLKLGNRIGQTIVHNERKTARPIAIEIL